MAHPERVLIVGATGRVGGQILQLLRGQRVNLRVLVRDARAIGKLPAGIEAVVGTLDDDIKLAAATSGVDCVFVGIRDCPEQIELESRLIAAAEYAGVSRFVKLSAFAAGLEPPPGYGRIHAEIERVLIASGMAWTILRPYVYMQNFFDVAAAVRSAGVLPLPLGGCRVAYIDAHDVARVAAAILRSSAYVGQTLVLTGPEALRLRDCARVFSDVLGRKVRGMASPQWLANLLMRRDGVSTWDIRMRSELFAMLRDDGEAQLTDSVGRVAGAAPTSLRAFLESHRDNFA